MEERDNYIREIKKQFLCGTPVKHILKNIINNKNILLDTEFQKKILNTTVNSALIQKFPLKISYQKLFLKNIILELETQGQEIQEDLYNTYCKLIALQDKQVQTHYRHYILNEQDDSHCLTIEESTSLISHGTTGLCSWQASSILADWCIRHKDIFHGKTVIELGSGVGLLGLSVVKECSPKQYIFSDKHSRVLDMLCSNILRNCTNSNMSNLTDEELKLHLQYNNVNIKVVRLLWEEIDSWILTNHVKPDIILAADVLFDNSVFPFLASGLKSLLSVSNGFSIVAASVRNEDTVSQFLNELDNYAFVYKDEVVPEQNLFPQWDNIPVRVIKLLYKTT